MVKGTVEVKTLYSLTVADLTKEQILILKHSVQNPTCDPNDESDAARDLRYAIWDAIDPILG